jgi:hypothetical protein
MYFPKRDLSLGEFCHPWDLCYERFALHISRMRPKSHEVVPVRAVAQLSYRTHIRWLSSNTTRGAGPWFQGGKVLIGSVAPKLRTNSETHSEWSDSYPHNTTLTLKCFDSQPPRRFVTSELRRWVSDHQQRLTRDRWRYSCNRGHLHCNRWWPFGQLIARPSCNEQTGQWLGQW